MKNIRQLWNSFNIAISMYSRLPAAQVKWTEKNEKYVMCFFPLIGIPIGLICYLWFLLSRFVPMRDPLRCVILIAIPVLISGGIHLDGFLDTCDALSSFKTRDERLRILKDPHTGAFAVIWGIVYFLVLYGALDSLSTLKMAGVYAFTFVISRSLSAISVVSFPKASKEGTVSGFSRSAADRTTRIVCIFYIFLSAVFMLVISPAFAAAALLGALLSFLVYYRVSLKSFGGINGDLAGFFTSICELLMPLFMAAASFIG